ncbi:MAG: ASCH domain-containing protein [Chloroflexi bacterium]|nr:ASCH domain-containing protein [Chloroflexota bacterium]
MKALSIRQPWAELILQGRKTIELRTWQTHYRGRIAIHASQTVQEEACVAYGLDPARVVRGALIGTVELVDILPLDEAAWEALRDQHLSLREFPGPIFGWRLEAPQRLSQPIPMRGRMSLFNVPDEVITGKSPPPPRATYTMPFDKLRTPPRDAPSYDPEKPFELHVVPRDDGDYGLALYQWPVAANSEVSKPQRLVELAGDSLRAVADHVLEALRKSGYKVTDLSRNRRQPFQLDEETGLRLGLLFLAVKPLTRMDRVEAISSGLHTMPSEEAYYWFSKCTAGASAVNAQRALRILFAGE